MMRRFLYFTLAAFFVCGAFFMVPEAVPGEENPYKPLYSIMEKGQAQVVEGELHYWASLHGGENINNAEQLDQKADELLERLVPGQGAIITPAAGEAAGINDAGNAQRTPGENNAGNAQRTPGGNGASDSLPEGEGAFEEPDYSGEAKLPEPPEALVAERTGELPGYGYFRMLLQDMKINGEDKLYLLITVTQEGEAHSLSELSRRLPVALKAEAEETLLSFCLTGHVGQGLKERDLEALAFELVGELDGAQVNKVQEGKMISISGYTPRFDDYVQYGDQRLNLNLAVRYDDHLGKTVIFAATPLIHRCY